jgi:hypothetical protein
MMKTPSKSRAKSGQQLDHLVLELVGLILELVFAILIA